MNDFLQSFFDLQIISDSAPMLWQGTWVTLSLSALSVPVGLLGGFILAYLSSLPQPWIKRGVELWVDFFRSFPPLVVIIFIYSGSAFSGFELGAWQTVLLSFFLTCGAYFGEVLRGGLENLPPGQLEAARSTGLTHGQALFYVALPQVVRNLMPELLSNVVEVVKLTSLASIVALPELLYQARAAQGLYFNASPIMAAAGIYLIILMPLVRYLSIMEERSRRKTMRSQDPSS